MERGTRFLETTLGPQVSVLPGSQLELQVPGRTRSTSETELSERNESTCSELVQWQEDVKSFAGEPLLGRALVAYRSFFAI